MIETKEMIALPNPNMISTNGVDYSTLTNENYKQLLSESTVEKIESYLEDSFFLDDMIEFIQEHGDTAFCNHYSEYVDAGEDESYEAADAFIEEFGVQYLENFQDSYCGYWNSKEEYAEDYVSNCYSVDLPNFVEVDWEATFDNLECIYSNGFVFNSQF